MKSRFCDTVVRRAPLPVLVGEVGGGFELLAGETAAQHRSSHIAEAGLLLAMDADVIAKRFVGHHFSGARESNWKSISRLQFFEKFPGGPPFLREEVLEPGAIPGSRAAPADRERFQ